MWPENNTNLSATSPQNTIPSVVVWNSLLHPKTKTDSSTSSSSGSTHMTDEEKFQTFHKEADYFAPPSPPPRTMKYIYNGPYATTDTGTSNSRSNKNNNKVQNRSTKSKYQLHQRNKLRKKDSKIFLLKKKIMRNMQYTSPNWKSYVFNADNPTKRPGFMRRLDQHIRNPITWESVDVKNFNDRTKTKIDQPLFELTMLDDVLYVKPCVRCRMVENVRNPITWEENLFRRGENC